jgi:hypothetical protein
MPDDVTLFISHKGEDAKIAEDVADAIQTLSANVLKCFLSEKIKHGQNWLEELHGFLKASKYLILIYTDPNEDWSWCMYEAGYFSASRSLQPSKDRQIFCLHHPELDPPSPLAHLQAIKVTSERVRQFISGLVDDIGIKAAPDQQENAVGKITACFANRDRKPFTSHRLTLIVPDKDKISPLRDLAEALPDGSGFRGAHESLMAIFQRSDGSNRLSWKLAVDTSRRVAEIGDSFERFDIKWLAEVVDVMYRVSEYFAPPQRPIRGLVFTGANGTVYSPVIYEVSEHRTGVLSCELVFLPWDGNQYPKAPEHIRQLMIATRVAVRFRQEFLEEFKDLGAIARLQNSLGRREGRNFRARVWRAFYEVMTESTHRGLTIMSLNGAFNDRERDKLRAMSIQSAEARTELVDILGGREDLGSSVVRDKDQEFTQDSIERLDRIYEIFDDSNLLFLAMASKAVGRYFSSLVTEQRWKAIQEEVAELGR